MPGGAAPALAIDDNGDGTVERTVAAASELAIPDPPPQIVAATQIVPGFGPGGDKHGRNVAVLFSEKVDAATAKNAANYAVDANLVKTATLQPGGRMAFLLLRDGIGPFFERPLTVEGLVDTAGQAMSAPQTLPIRTTANGPAAVVDGVVREANGAPVAGAKVSLLQLIWYDDGFSIEERYAIFSEKQADENGAFHFDYVLQNDDPAGPFLLEAVHPAAGEAGQLTTGVSFHGQRLGLDIFMKARGSLSGRVLNASGQRRGRRHRPGHHPQRRPPLHQDHRRRRRLRLRRALRRRLPSQGGEHRRPVRRADHGDPPRGGRSGLQDVTIYPLAGVARGDSAARSSPPTGSPRAAASS